MEKGVSGAVKFLCWAVPNDKNFAQLTRIYAGLAVSTHRALHRRLGGEKVLKAVP